MESAEQAFIEVSPTMKYTISKSSEDGPTNQTSKSNHSSSLPEQANASLQTNLTLASPNVSSYVKPVELHCEVGSVLKITGSDNTTFCGKTEDA